jgi:hypothetical protein
MIDLSGKTSFSSIRFRLLLLLAAAVMPFVLILVMAYFWVYQPLQSEVAVISRDIETRFDGVARLQLVLTRSAMPVNDFLIHGHESERRQYQMLEAQVEAAFSTVRVALGKLDPEEREHIDRLYDRWRQSARQGATILALNPESRRQAGAAAAMETFDQHLDELVDDAADLLDHVRLDLTRSRNQLEIRRERMTWLFVVAAFMATLVTLSATLYLGQRVIPPLARALRSDIGEAPEDSKSDPA